VSVALVIQHAKRIHRIISSSVACLAVSYISTLSHKQQDFRKMLEKIKRVLIFSKTLSETFLIQEELSEILL
jgi:hypothetical protein